MSFNKKTKDKVVKKYIFEAIYIAIFIVVAVFVGLHHEHWADEAQSWLIARDNNVIGIFKAIRYEGTPALWQLLLKLCIVLGMEYNQLYILTTALTVIGIIFLHKNENIPLVFKVLLPYTYYIFFQYTIVARSYTLLFPILMAIVYLYPNKKEHLVKYGILLTLLMNVSLHGFLLAGGFWLEFLIDEIQKSRDKKEKMSAELRYFFEILTILFVVVVVYVMPASDCSTGLGSLEEWYTILSGVMFTSSANIIANVIGIVLFIILYARLIKLNNVESTIRTISLSIFNIAWIVFIHGKAWHIGIIFLIILSISIINNDLKNDKIIYALIMLSVIIQIVWNVSSIVYDFKNPYSSGEMASEYLKQIGVEDKKIVAVDFWAVQLNPYFEKNLYENFNKSYYTWNTDEAKRTIAKKIYEKGIEPEVDIYVIPFYYYFQYENGKEMIATNSSKYEHLIMEELDASGNYEKKTFESVMCFKGLEYESTGVYIYSKK